MKLAKKIERLQKLLTREKWIKKHYCMSKHGFPVERRSEADSSCQFCLSGGMVFLNFNESEYAAMDNCVKEFSPDFTDLIDLNDCGKTTYEDVQKFLEYAKNTIGEYEYPSVEETPDVFDRA